MQSSRRKFDFHADTLSFANETKWVYEIDEDLGKQIARSRDKVPKYFLRCFVLVRCVKQYWLHTKFVPDAEKYSDEEYRNLVRRLAKSHTWRESNGADKIEIPGFANLREFSAAHERDFKELNGGPWQSYVQRGNWRMVFPVTRTHQAKTAEHICAQIGSGFPDAVHIFRFPQLTINHALLFFDYEEDGEKIEFQTYDPNIPEAPVPVTFDKARREFSMPKTHYYKGGMLNAYSVYRNWIY